MKDYTLKFINSLDLVRAIKSPTPRPRPRFVIIGATLAVVLLAAAITASLI